MINERYPLAGYVAELNPHLRQRRRFPLIRIVLGCAALAGLLWFVCNIVVVAGP